MIRGGKAVSAGHTLPPSWIAVDRCKIVAKGRLSLERAVALCSENPDWVLHPIIAVGWQDLSGKRIHYRRGGNRPALRVVCRRRKPPIKTITPTAKRPIATSSENNIIVINSGIMCPMTRTPIR